MLWSNWCISSRKAYIEYADFCFNIFGARVKNWFTFNEPRCMTSLGYDNGINPPARCSKEFGNCTAGDSATEPYIAAHNILLAHAGAVRRYRTKYQVRVLWSIVLVPATTKCKQLLWYSVLSLLGEIVRSSETTRRENWNSVGFYLVRTSHRFHGWHLSSSKSQGFPSWMVIAITCLIEGCFTRFKWLSNSHLCLWAYYLQVPSSHHLWKVPRFNAGYCGREAPQIYQRRNKDCERLNRFCGH